MKIMYSEREPGELYNLATISLLQEVGDVVVVGEDLAGFSSDFDLLVIGSPGNTYTEHASRGFIGSLDVNILSLCRNTSRTDGSLGLATASTGETVSQYWRGPEAETDARFPGPIVEFSSVGTNPIYDPVDGVEVLYTQNDNEPRAGVFRMYTPSGKMRAHMSYYRFDVATQELRDIFLALVVKPLAVPLSGQVLTDQMVPPDRIFILNWQSGQLIQRLRPNADGTWSTMVPVGEYGLVYISEGCQPIVHGPYLALEG